MDVNRAESYGAVLPLIELIKPWKLFAVQEWCRWETIERSLIMATPEYTEQLLGWFGRYWAYTRDTAQELLRPPILREVLGTSVRALDKKAETLPKTMEAQL